MCVCVCVCSCVYELGQDRMGRKESCAKKSKGITKYSFESLDSQGEKGTIDLMPNTRNYVTLPEGSNFLFVSDHCLHFSKESYLYLKKK